ncbi:MAG: methylated-DNA--[protein]-cysteine S-methyltransferase [Sphingomonadaceae bacterium]|nr:methylated-DNA--[protein]-cysteine S-methyltransferase [Sphingomonadaceae bacterium]
MLHFRLSLHRHETPMGELLLSTDGDMNLRTLDFADHEPRMLRLLSLYYGSFELIEAEVPQKLSEPLDRYFAGELDALATIPWATSGTLFQNKVWSALNTIPPGTTASYGEIARKIGSPNASRAVGAANGSNPVGIVVPCHRVVGGNGALTGYGGGIERKRWLLEHERRYSTKSLC